MLNCAGGKIVQKKEKKGNVATTHSAEKFSWGGGPELCYV